MALNYPQENRIFEEMRNTNDRFYRESETHAKVHLAKEMLREDFGFEKKIYEHIHDPGQSYQEIQGKMYRSE